ncbi:MAG TPA: 1,4-alpha-glucan branching protein GlgB [Mycobacteriales bacterium]|nr:1,4-alpha-glucan branching protein GlgB [Mycobacteriales bacterium]
MAEPIGAQLDALARGEHRDPHALLGARAGKTRTTLRALRPDAIAVHAVVKDERIPLKKVHDGGIFAATLPGSDVPDYRIEATYASGETFTTDDPYRFLPSLGEVDLHLIGEGRHEDLWMRLGARVRHYGDICGVSFAVWAPNARGVRLVGDVNFWDGRGHPMRQMGSSGVWELFVPDVGEGSAYKYEILGADGVWRQKLDPLALRTMAPPETAGVVFTSTYEWNDAEWLAERAKLTAHRRPMSVYEVHLASWRQGLSYRELADELVDYVRDMGFTHVELLPVAEHPFGGSWGYQVSAYYAPTARFGSPDDFRFLVDRLHQAGIGVIVDWVPAHFPKDEFALARFDGTALYEHADPRRGEHPDWGTLVFNFGRNEVRNFLIANALFWIEEFHVDGLRVDAVASMLYLDYSRKDGEWLPNEYGGRENLDAVKFMQEMNEVVYRRNPGVMTIAEESTAWPSVSRPVHLGGLGFGFKWNMGWMHDTLSYASKPPIYRQYHHHQMTFSMMYAYSENFVLPISHDEVVHGKGSLINKMPGSTEEKFAQLRALLGYMWAHPGKQLLFMGSEIAQGREWNHDTSLDWDLLENESHRGVQSVVRDLNRIYRDTAALWAQDVDPAGFAWIDANDAAGNVLSFLRWDSAGRPLACVTNFAGVTRGGYRLGLPLAGTWHEVLNTDAREYGGSGYGNFGVVTAADSAWHGQPASAEVVLPGLSTIWLVPDEVGQAKPARPSEPEYVAPPPAG